MAKARVGHPLQPFVMDGKVVRFKRNNLVRFILDNCKYDLNDLARMDFTLEDRAQLAMLIGYSVSGFGELEYMSWKEIEKLDEKAAEFLQKEQVKDLMRS